jgi:hypothetical protein
MFFLLYELLKAEPNLMNFQLLLFPDLSEETSKQYFRYIPCLLFNVLFLLNSKYFLLFFIAAFLTHELLQSIFSNFQMNGSL